MFGDIVTDLASVLQGGMGMAVGCNVGDKHGMFEPIHGSAPPLAGKNVANPIATILAVREALAWQARRMGHAELLAASDRIEAAIKSVLREGVVLPADLTTADRASTTTEVGAAILAQLVV